jgi:hypothetical protein
MSSGSSQELLSGSGAELSGPAVSKVESTGVENKMRTVLSDCDGRLKSALSSKSVVEQAAGSLAPTCMFSGGVSHNTDNSVSVLVDINKASGICPAPTTETTWANVHVVDLSAPNPELKSVSGDSSNCIDETVTSSGDAEVCASSTTTRHLSFADKGMLHEAAASYIKGPHSVPSTIEKAGDDAASNIKVPTLSIYVS